MRARREGMRLAARPAMSLIDRILSASRGVRRALPGDDLLPHARFERTHTQRIAAPPDRVFPWLVQMGCGRGGWYSYDFIDNGGLPSATRIIPELQDLEVGDLIAEDDAAFAVLAIVEGRALVLGSPSLLPGEGAEEGPFQSTWSFLVEPIGERESLLTVRVRADFEPSLRMTATRLLFGVTHEVMERKQLRTLKQRAESLAGAA